MLGLTQQALAARVNCSLSLLRKIEAGSRRPTRLVAERLIKGLEVPSQDAPALLDAALKNMPLSTAEAAGSDHVPLLVTPLIGRKPLLDDLLKRVQSPDLRLLSLLGPPGVGKTSLALALAARLATRFKEGVVFADLAPLRETPLALLEIAHVLGAHEQIGKPILETIITTVGNQQILLLLDNCEQLPDLGRPIAALLTACPRLRIVVTSRTPLRLRAERRVLIPPLELPQPGTQQNLTILKATPATALFIDRAEAVAPELVFDKTQAAAVALICIRLDGLPLAIELAAAYCDQLKPSEILAQLEQRLPMLVDGPIDLPERQQSLSDAIRWSYALLSPAAQQTFMHLGVFVGSFAIEQAHDVLAPIAPKGQHAAEDLLDLLERQSLIQRDRFLPDQQRYRLLETLREFALECLNADSQAEAQAYQAHAAAYAALAEQAELQLSGQQDKLWLSRLDADLENLRSAVGWSLQHDEGVLATRITVALHVYWQARSLWRDGHRILPLLQSGGTSVPTPLRLRAYDTVGFMLSQHTSETHSHQAIWLFQQERQLAYELEDADGIVRSLSMLAMMARYPGNYDYVNALLREAISVAERDAPTMRSTAYLQMTHLLQEHGDYAEAINYLEKLIALSRAEKRMVPLTRALPMLADLLFQHGAIKKATTINREALALATERHIPDALAYGHAVQGMLAEQHGDLTLARQSYRDSISAFRELHMLPDTARMLSYLGFFELSYGTLSDADQILHEAFQLASNIFLIATMGYTLYGLAAVAAHQQNAVRAMRLNGAASALHERFSLAVFPPADNAQRQTQMLAVTQLSAERAQQIYHETYQAVISRLPVVTFEHSMQAFVTLQLARLLHEVLDIPAEP